MNKSILFGTILSVLFLCSLIIYPIEASEIHEIMENSPELGNDLENIIKGRVTRFFVMGLLNEKANFTDGDFDIHCNFFIGLLINKYLSINHCEFSIEFEYFSGDLHIIRSHGDELKFYGISNDHFICGMVVWKD